MPEFHIEKIGDCVTILENSLTNVTIPPHVRIAVAKRFEPIFRPLLLDDSSATNRKGKAAWKKVGKALEAQVRKVAALTEYYAREDGATEVTLSHLKKAIADVRERCPVNIDPIKKRRYIFCGDPWS